MYLQSASAFHVFSPANDMWISYSYGYPLAAIGTWLSSEVKDSHVQMQHWTVDNFGDLVPVTGNPYAPEVMEVLTCHWIPANCGMLRSYDVGH